MSNKELLPCPFCDGEADILQHKDGIDDWIVFCKKCGCQTDFMFTEYEAVYAWNTRNYPEIPNSSKPIMIVANTDELKPLLTRSDIEKMVKPLQWEEQTMHCFGTKDLKANFHGLVFLIIPQNLEQIRGLKKFRLTVHGTPVYVSCNNDKKKAQDELKQYAQKWLVDFICSALGVEEEK